MKFFWIGSAYTEGINSVISKFTEKDVQELTYDELKGKIYSYYLDYISKGWAEALELFGYEMQYVMYNAEVLQHKWYLENIGNDVNGVALEDILYLQIKKYQPEVLYVNDCFSKEYINRLREDIPSIKLVIAWGGSATAKNPRLLNMYRSVDLILCCAPEGVKYLNAQGANCLHMNHAFFRDRRFMFPTANYTDDITFIGSLIRAKDFHLEREKLLIELSRRTSISIYTTSACYPLQLYFKTYLKRGMYYLLRYTPEQVRNIFINNVKIFDRVFHAGFPLLPVNPAIKPYIQMPVFGQDMLDTLHKSRVVLNIHADSSPLYASNMRLYEATGVNSCLLTDYKDNLNELFKLNEEVVAYTCVEDCLEKASYLLKHRDVRMRIAEAGYNRCMRDHTYKNRAEQLDRVIRERLLCNRCNNYC